MRRKMKPKKRDRKEILASEKQMSNMIDELKLHSWQGCILAPANGIAPIEKRIRIAYLYLLFPPKQKGKRMSFWSNNLRLDFYMDNFGVITIEKSKHNKITHSFGEKWKITETYIFDETIVKGGELEQTIKT